MIYFFIRSIFSEIKMNKVNRQKGFSQIILLVIISFLAIALPITIRLVQQNQENRSSAATESTYGGVIFCSDPGKKSCIDGYQYICDSGEMRKTTTKCISIIPATYNRSGCDTSTGLYNCTLNTSGSGYDSISACQGTATDSLCPKSNACTPGQGRCDGTGGYSICNSNSTWPVKSTPCPSGQACSGNGVCSGIIGCSDPGQKSCIDGYFYICVSGTMQKSTDKCISPIIPATYNRSGCDTSTGLYDCTINNSGTGYDSISACQGTATDSLCPKSGGSSCTGTTGRADGCSCSSASQCASGACNAGGLCSSICSSMVANKPVGCSCIADNQCASGKCTNNSCTAPIDTTKCTKGTKRCYSSSQTQICGDDSKWGSPTTCSSGVCVMATGDCKSGGGPGPGPGPGPSIICTADTVSTTECYDSTHLKKCNSDGTAWIQGDQCAFNQACQNGVCGGVGAKLSFKFAFDGVAPANLSCLDNFKKVTLTVGKVGTTLVQEMSADVTKTDLTNSKGYAIFGADNVALGTGFSGASNIYVKIKGQVHARMYYCVKSQSSKNTSQICNLSLDGTVNNFYEYPVLAGDVDQNGIVNTADFSVIKTALFTTGCGINTDLNGDGIVNEFDVKLFKVALEAKYDE